jgi:cytoskeletal protein CcmA (bactofilin family)
MSSQICSDVEIKGSIVFKDKLVFDGVLTAGSIQGDALVVGEHGNIHGDIKAAFLTIQGQVTGNAEVAEKTVLGASGSLTGDLSTARLTMSEGATFCGGSKIGPRQFGPPKLEPVKEKTA